jgi:hypothetical protein
MSWHVVEEIGELVCYLMGEEAVPMRTRGKASTKVEGLSFHSIPFHFVPFRFHFR